MLASPSPTTRPLTSDEHGFTLIELVVAMATGMMVCLALFAILDFSTRQETRIADAAQANQLGRTAMTKIVDELHSACIAPEFTPILEKSSETELWFINSYSSEAVISQASEHKVVWSGEKLVDYTYPSVSGSWPHFTYATVASPSGGVVLGTKITQSESGGKKIPIFQYYSYSTKYTSGTEAGVSMLNTEALKTSLTNVTAPTAAAVAINFSTAPSETNATIHDFSNLNAASSDLVTLAFSAPHSESTTVDGPCQ
jgi:Tfp pilus assembly protein PilW